MTNNPEKIAALRKAGLDVVSDQRVLGRPTAENVRYLAAKRDRAGHFIDLEGMLAFGNIRWALALPVSVCHPCIWFGPQQLFAGPAYVLLANKKYSSTTR